MNLINNTSLNLHSNCPDFIEQFKVDLLEEKDNVSTYLFSFVLNDLERKELNITWEENIFNIFDIFKPSNNHDKRYLPSDKKSKNESCIFLPAPFIVALNSYNQAVLNISVLDPVNNVTIGVGAVEKNGLPEVGITLFKEFPLTQKEYKVEVRVDRRVLDFSKSVKDVTNYLYKGENRTIEEDCYSPLYSTWYNFHRDIDQKTLLDEMKIASQYGMKTLIIDDGWQIEKTDNQGGGYTFAGDWKVAKSKFPDLKQFVLDCHDLGIKVMVWLAIPYVGHSCESYLKFKDKTLYDRADCAVLDPRYKEVRDYIISSCVKLMKENGLDGLKLDFVDSFKNINNVGYKEGMDVANLPAAVELLFKDICEALNSVKESPLIEFRQNYTSPALLKNANMIRVNDCPIEYKSNYNEIAYLRLTTRVAVHSDMIAFNKGEPLEQKARHLYASLFSTPQLSLVLSSLDEDEKKLLKSYLDFHKAYEPIIFNDQFEVFRFSGALTHALNGKDGNLLYCLYLNKTLKIAGKVNTIVNLTGESKLFIELNSSKAYEIQIFNCFNELVNSFNTNNQEVLSIENKDLFIVKITEK